MRVVLLDSGPLGLVTNPKASQSNLECQRWRSSLLLNRVRVLVPELADYEVRRELLRVNFVEGVRKLDALKNEIGYLPITTTAMLKAAELWASVRQAGIPTADSKALDGDVILAAQAVTLAVQDYDVEIATTNVSHLARLTKAYNWQEVR